MALFVLMRTASPTDFINNLLDIQALYGCPTPEDSRPPVDSTGLGAPPAAGVEKTPTVYSHVNRVLDRIAAAAGIVVTLTSHSFRRGGAQHTNGSGETTERWIFDREHEHNKQGLRLFFNTSTDDYSVNNHHRLGAPGLVKDHDFPPFWRIPQPTSCTARHNRAVLDVLASTVIRHYPQLHRLSAEAPAVKRMKLVRGDIPPLNYLHGYRISRIQSYPQAIKFSPDIRADIPTKHRTEGHLASSRCH
ncbi:LOW QUALITY PROTEIN: RxLR effector candidate protein [Phytophthora palmivora]|uniref:RxLR effector candidate protein n=1 Tax=Phytophthora palmivora TaxID=4796 RepID=A0A2P4X8R8_9STRA|nr:LOW QUALITY PROTEIN: RxLR effector candidate protein [Phytophthora palmivora]